MERYDEELAAAPDDKAAQAVRLPGDFAPPRELWQWCEWESSPALVAAVRRAATKDAATPRDKPMRRRADAKEVTPVPDAMMTVGEPAIGRGEAFLYLLETLLAKLQAWGLHLHAVPIAHLSVPALLRSWRRDVSLPLLLV